MMAWYDASWTKRRKVTVPASQISSTLSNFPVYVDLSGLGITNHDGIRVTTSDGSTEVPREIVSSGELHFKAPSLSSSSNTEFYIYYGNAGASDYFTNATYGAENVWTNAFVGVWHLEEDPSGTAPQILDSTSNKYHGTVSGSPTSVTNVVGKGLSFDGNSAIDVGSDSGLQVSPEITVSAFLKFNSLSNNTRPLSDWHQSGATDRWLFYATSSTTLGLHINGVTAQDSVTLNTWNYYVGTFDGSTVRWYKDGTLAASGAKTYTLNTNTGESTRFGKQAEAGNGLNGFMDEVRLSSVKREDYWIYSENINLNSPGTFYTLSAEEENTAVTSPFPTFRPSVS